MTYFFFMLGLLLGGCGGFILHGLFSMNDWQGPKDEDL